MFLAGATMGVSDWLGYYARKGDSVAGTLGAAGPPLIALAALAF
jgi:putative membrane protein